MCGVQKRYVFAKLSRGKQGPVFFLMSSDPIGISHFVLRLTMAPIQILKYGLLFCVLSALSVLLSPILIPFFVCVVLPLLLIFVGSLMLNASGTIAFILRLYHDFNVLKHKYYYRTSPENRSHARLISGEAWDDFCDALKCASAAISSGPSDELTQAEGYRFLARTTRAGLAVFLEYSDARTPKLHSLIGETIKMGADNPDNLYQSAPLLSQHSYRLCGYRGTVKYISFGTQLGHYGKRAGMPPIDFLDSESLKYFANKNTENSDSTTSGSSDSDTDTESKGKYFEIILSPQKPHNLENVNWLRLDAKEECTLIVRQTFGIRENETTAALELERYFLADEEADEKCDALDVDAFKKRNQSQKAKVQPLPLRALKVDESLSSAASLVSGACLMFAKWGNKMRRSTDCNKLPVLLDQTEYRNAGGDPNMLCVFFFCEFLIFENSNKMCAL